MTDYQKHLAEITAANLAEQEKIQAADLLANERSVKADAAREDLRVANEVAAEKAAKIAAEKAAEKNA